MMIALILWLIKKYIKPALANPRFDRLNQLKFYSLRRAGQTLAFLLLCTLPSRAQEQTIHYRVLHNGKVVGQMQLCKKQQQDNLLLKMTSEVKMRFLFSIKVNIEEESLFKNGTLVYSKVNRKVNGKEKANRFTKNTGDAYQTSTEGKIGIISKKQINYNLTMLYYQEPTHTLEVYSDNFQQFLSIKPTEPHVYRIDLPDGNYNFYHYQNGMCNRVDVHHSLYTIQIQLA